VFTFRRFNRNLSKKSRFFIGALKSNIIDLVSKKDLLIIAFFTLLGAGGVFAATLITITTPDSQGAGYVVTTACDENVTVKALTAPHTASGQLYVATIALSDISQNATTGCGGKIMQIALKINGQMSYSSWSIPAASSDSTFYLTSATTSINTYYADTLLSPFQADGLTNVAISQIGSFNFDFIWTKRTPVGATIKTWPAIASSSDGTKLVAAPSTGYIYTSSDSGVTWTEQTGSGSRSWTDLTSSSDGIKLAAVSGGATTGYIYTSTNSGVTWTQRSPLTASTPRNWYSITSSSDGTKLAAGVNYGYVYTSSDSGATWTERSPAATQQRWLSMASSSDGTKLVVGTNNDYIYTSSDSGITWTQRISCNCFGMASSSDGTMLAASAYGGSIYTSTNSGVTWTTRTAAGSRNWYSITSSSDGTKLAAVAYGAHIYTSSDSGVTWEQVTDSVVAGVSGTTPRNWYSITSSSDGTKLAAGVFSGYIYTGAK
jgi:photosystem II stability/assembly factor-like uncharacterized protein